MTAIALLLLAQLACVLLIGETPTMNAVKAFFRQAHWWAAVVALAGVVIAVNNGNAEAALTAGAAVLCALGIHLNLPVPTSKDTSPPSQS